MIYLDNNTDTQVIYIPRKAQEPEYMPINKPIEINIDTVKVQDNLMTYSRTIKPENTREGYSTITVSVEVPMSEEKLTDNGLFSFDMPVGTVEVDTSAYGEQRYIEGYNVGYEERAELPLEPCTIADLIAFANLIGVGGRTNNNFLVEGTITRITTVDLKYGNARYWISDDMGNEIEVFRGYNLFGEHFISEDEIQVGQIVKLVCGVQNYKGTPQIYQGSYLIDIKDGLIFQRDHWGIVGQHNDWGNKPDTYFEDAGFELLEQDARVVYNFKSDGSEIKIRWNNEWEQTYTAALYNAPQLAMAEVGGDWGIDLPVGNWDIYIIGKDGIADTFTIQQILVVEAGTNVLSLNLTPTLTVDTGGKVMEIEFVNDYDGSGQTITTDTQATFTTHYGNTGFVVGYIDGEEVNASDFISTGEDIYIQF